MFSRISTLSAYTLNVISSNQSELKPSMFVAVATTTINCSYYSLSPTKYHKHVTIRWTKCVDVAS